MRTALQFAGFGNPAELKDSFLLLTDRLLGELEGLAHHSGLLLGSDGLMPEGGEPQYW